MKHPRCYRYSKRALDLLGSLVLLVVLAPVLAAIGWLLSRTLGRPVLFRQERAGIHGRPFHILKFRSMSVQRDPRGRLLPDIQRLSALGRFLRRSSMDELPQLWNVVKGEMSLVGPRPLFVDYVPRYSERQLRRLDVRPGITGLAQISGRINLEWTERLNLDVDYVERASLGLDLLILLRTLKKVVVRDDVPDTGVNPTRPFLGDGVSDEAQGGEGDESATYSGSKDLREGASPRRPSGLE